MLDYTPFEDYNVSRFENLMQSRDEGNADVDGIEVYLEPFSKKSYKAYINGEYVGASGDSQGMFNLVASELEDVVEGDSDNEIAAAVGRVVDDLLDGYEPEDD